MADLTEEIREIVGEVLSSHSFSVAREPLGMPGSECVFAENEFFVLAVLIGETLDELEAAESLATRELLRRLGETDLGAKRWDAYILLLTSQAWTTVDDRERSALTYDTRGVRRLVSAQTTPDAQSVSRALTIFLPLGHPLDTGLGTVDADLVDALEVNGISRASADRYVAAYRQTGSIEDV